MSDANRNYRADAEHDLAVIGKSLTCGNRDFAVAYLETKYQLCHAAGLIEGAFSKAARDAGEDPQC